MSGTASGGQGGVAGNGVIVADTSAPGATPACSCRLVGKPNRSDEHASILLSLLLAALARRRKMNILTSSCAS
jgi:hypothetical protein